MRLIAFVMALIPASVAYGQDKKPEVIDVTGRIEGTTTDVRPRVSGYISAIRVREGVVVKQGTVIAELDSRVFQAEFEKAKAMLTRAEAQAKVADVKFERVKSAVEKGIVPKEEVDQALAEREVTRAELMAAKAELALAQLNLSYTKITALTEGRLGQLRLTEGNLVRADTDLLVTIVRADPLFVVFDVDERTVLKLLPNLKDKKLTAAVGFSNEEGFPHEITIDFVAPAIDPEKGTLRVRAKLPNPKGTHIPGQFTRVRLTLLK